MKKYEQLSPAQRDKAADKALGILVRQIVEGFLRPKLSKQNQDFVTYWITNMDKEFAYAKILDSDEVAEELWPLAEEMAAAAIYPEGGEYVINDVA